jgi:uncharacterized protein (DUF697 family)
MEDLMTDAASMTDGSAAQDGPEVIRDVADQIIRRHSVYGALGGLLPLPGFDVAVIVGVQIKMIAELCEVYGERFSKQIVKAYVVSLVGGALPMSGISVAIGSAVKSIPGIGALIGMLVVPGVAAASTWAVGKVFAWHFEQGGTLADFDVETHRPRFQREFAAARGRAKHAASDAAA